MPMPLSAVECSPGASERLCPLWASSLLGIAGSLFALTGAGLVIAAVPAPTDKSTFYVFAGLALIISGVLLGKRYFAGVWTYLAVVAATLVWAMRNISLAGSSLSYRLVGPLIMVAMIGALIPLLRPKESRRGRPQPRNADDRHVALHSRRDLSGERAHGAFPPSSPRLR